MIASGAAALDHDRITFCLAVSLLCDMSWFLEVMRDVTV
jgi:hypothetical protein